MGGVIMAFWDNFEKKATDATANVVSKVKGVSDITRLNSMVSEEENRIREIYFKIGQTYVTLHGRDNEAGFADLLNALKASQLKVERYKQEIMDIRGVQKCERCGAEVAAGAAFCMTCGAQIPKTAFISLVLTLLFTNSCRGRFVKQDKPQGKKRTPNM